MAAVIKLELTVEEMTLMQYGLSHAADNAERVAVFEKHSGRVTMDETAKDLWALIRRLDEACAVYLDTVINRTKDGKLE